MWSRLKGRARLKWKNRKIVLMFMTLVFGLTLLTQEVVAQRAMMTYYDSGALQVPRYRAWDGTAWSNEGSANDVGGTIQWTVLKAAPNRNEYILGTLDNESDVNVQIWNGAWGSVLEVEDAITAANDDYRGFDIAYEQGSGRAMIVYQDNTSTPKYRIWNGSSWTGEASVASIGTGIPIWVRLEANPNSDEIVLVTLDTNNDIYAQVWNGSSWGNVQLMESDAARLTTPYEVFDVAYEYNSGRALVVWGEEALSVPQYRIWSDSVWEEEENTNDVGAEPYWIKLASEPGSNRILMGALDLGKDVNVQTWTGDGWGTNFEVTGKADAATPRLFDVAFENSTGLGMISYGENNDKPRYRTCSGFDCTLGTWSAEGSALDSNNLGRGDPRWIRLMPDLNSDDIMLIHGDDASDIGVQRWTGAWGDALSAEQSSRFDFEAFSLAYKWDITPPSVTFVPPTDDNNTVLTTRNWTFINVSASDGRSDVDSALLEWNGVNESMNKDGAGKSAVFYLNKTNLADGVYTYRVWVNDSSANWGVSETRIITIDTTPPRWRNQGQSNSTPNVGDDVILYAQGYDEVKLSYAWLETNETGSFVNYTEADSAYGSPMYLGDVTDTWVWSNFTWSNPGIVDGTQVWWRIWYNDTAGNVNGTEYMSFIVTLVDTPPKWRNQGEDTTTPAVGDDVLLYAQGQDETALEFAWLETNETGVFVNYTNESGGVYGSPMDMGGVNTWTWSNFTWRNTSVVAGKTVWWRIWYNDSSGNVNKTNYRQFTLQAPSTIIQPSDIDSYMDEELPDANYGSDTVLKVRSFSGARNGRALVQFDLSSLPLGIIIDSAILQLYVTGIPDRLRTYDTYRVTNSWTEPDVTWNSRDDTNNWNSAGGDYADNPTNWTSAGTVNNVWVSWNITDDVRGWVNGSYQNYGTLIKDAVENDRRSREILFASKEYATAEYRPRLLISYSYLPDLAPPQWRNQGQSQDTPNVGDEVVLYAQGMDDTALLYAWLETNETGDWENKSGVYGSPMYLGSPPNQWVWSNFTWINPDIVDGTNVGWRIWYNDSSGNVNSTDIMSFTVTMVEGPPKWRNQGQSEDNPYEGATVSLYAQGYDETGLAFAWLETNESGAWENKSGVYGSPMDMGGVIGWTWSNFTWKNTSVTNGTHVGWRIWYNDTTGKVNVTDIMSFIVREAMITIQPSDMDSHIQGDRINNNYGTDAELKVRSRNNGNRRALVQFDLSDIPIGAEIQEVILELYVTVAPGSLRTYAAHRLTNSWTELGVTWVSRDGTNNWNSGGGDYVSTSTNTTMAGLVTNVWVSWNITDDVRSWYNDTYQNYGTLIKDDVENENAEIRFASKEHATSAYWPRLIVKFKLDITPPLWRNQRWNASSSNLTQIGRDVNLSAQGFDNLLLKYAWLETNETGAWENKSGVYGSPMLINVGNQWTWSNFTWRNTSLPIGTHVGWRIWYNDTAGNVNGTGIYNFTVVSWDSYSDAAFQTPENTFCNTTGTVIYHAGYGYEPNTIYTLAWYKPNGNLRKTDTSTSNATGWLNTSLTVDAADTAGEYRAVVYPDGSLPPPAYNPVDPEIIADDPFNLEYCPPIPEFGAMAIPVVASCALYLWMRRRRMKFSE